MAEDLRQLSKDLCPLSKAVFQEAEGLFLLNAGRSFFSEAGEARWEGLLLASKPHRLESEGLFIESERLGPSTRVGTANLVSVPTQRRRSRPRRGRGS